MALKKSQLYSSLWQSCDELRGGMDASQYKDYVLTLLFMKYVSDKYAGKPGALIEVPAGGNFADMVKLKGDKEIGDKINKIIAKLAEANDLKGVIDQADFNDEGKLGAGKEMQDRLSKLVAIFDGLDFRANRAEGDDLLGDAYEYLMRHFATESGKSKGQFYTPAEVSRIMAQVIGIERAGELREPTVYDPTCGSGSLLIKAADEAGTRNLAIYGQEMDVATWALARMNMILHGHPTAELWRGNTLSAPHFKNRDGSLRSFDFAVANPPFSAKAWSNGLHPENDEFRRFEYGIPPAKNGDYAFLLHLITSLKSTGKGAIILPQRCPAERHPRGIIHPREIP
jgi:type I restriction enzyme M protein